MNKCCGHNHRHTFIACSLIAFLNFLVFQPAIFADFRIWDDDSHIYCNPTLNHLSWHNFLDILNNNSYSTCFYTPLTGLRWSITYTWGGLDPFWFHLGNLLFHTANAIMVFFLIGMIVTITRSNEYEKGRLSPPLLSYMATIASLLWSLHPLRVEAVAGAVCGAHEQALFFGLISLIFYLWHVKKNGKHQMWLLTASGISYLASLLSQPVLIFLPLALLILDCYPLKRINTSGKTTVETNAKILFEKLPFILMSIIILNINLIILPNAALPGHQMVALGDFGIFERIMQAFYIWAYYLWRPFFPVELSPLYTTLIKFNPMSLPFLMSAATVLGITLLLIYKRHVWPSLMSAWLCYLVLLIPFLGLTEHPHYPADRYSLTVAIIPSILLTGWLMEQKKGHRLIFTMLIVPLIILLGMLSFRQTGVWENTITLGAQILKITENEPGHPYRARIFRRMALHHLEKGEYAQAESNLRKALAIIPDQYQYGNLLAHILINQNRRQEGEELLRKLIASHPYQTDARYNLALLLFEAGRFDEALQQAKKALLLAPGNQMLVNLIKKIDEEKK